MNCENFYKLEPHLQDGKIAYIMDVKDCLGGAGNHLLRHAVLSQSFGIKVIVVIPQYSENECNNDIKKVCINNELNYCFIDYNTAFDFSSIDGDKIKDSMNNFIQFIKNENIKLIHSVQLNPSVEMACRILKIPHVMSIYQIEKSNFEIGYPDIFAKFVHSDSFLYENIWREGLKSDSVCIRSYIPEKFQRDSGKEAKYACNKNEFNCIVSGSLCERKSQHKIIEVAGRLRKNGVKLNVKILGYVDRNSAYFSRCKTIEKQYELQEQIFYKGFCHNVELEMKEADFLICASNDESFPQVILEAMAMNIPVISTPVAGVPELIKNDVTGYLSQNFKAKSIEDAVIRYIYDYKYHYENIGMIVNNAYELYKIECSREAVSRKLFEFYYKAITNQYNYSDKQKNLDIALKDYYSFEMDNFINYMAQYLDEKKLELVKSNKFGVVYKINYIKKLYSNKKVKCYIWGASTAGEVTKYALENKLKNFNICGFIDSFKFGEFMGLKIYNPQDINYDEKIYIFVATGPGKKQAMEFLKDRNLEVNKNYISIFV